MEITWRLVQDWDSSARVTLVHQFLLWHKRPTDSFPIASRGVFTFCVSVLPVLHLAQHEVKIAVVSCSQEKYTNIQGLILPNARKFLPGGVMKSVMSSSEQNLSKIFR